LFEIWYGREANARLRWGGPQAGRGALAGDDTPGSEEGGGAAQSRERDQGKVQPSPEGNEKGGPEPSLE